MSFLFYFLRGLLASKDNKSDRFVQVFLASAFEFQLIYDSVVIIFMLRTQYLLPDG